MEHHDELEQLRARVAHLESLVEGLAADPPGVRPVARPRPVDAPENSGVDRRRMLRNGLGLGAAAVAGVGVVDALGSSAAAANGDAVTVAQTVSPTDAADNPTRILNPSSSSHASVLFQVDNATDSTIPMPTDTYAAILGTASGHDNSPQFLAGVLGLSDYGVGVRGHSDGDTGVAGSSTNGVGINGTSGHDAGVSATSDSGPGLKATSTSGHGIEATSTTGEAIHATASNDQVAIVGYGGFGVVGNGTGTSGGIGVGATGGTGVLTHGTTVGVDASTQSGIAVKAASTSGTAVSVTSESGSGLVVASTSGVGARLKGGTAAVRLVPQPTAGAPSSGTHQRGELLVDSKGKAWLCTTGGTPGTWRQIAFV